RPFARALVYKHVRCKMEGMSYITFNLGDPLDDDAGYEREIRDGSERMAEAGRRMRAEREQMVLDAITGGSAMENELPGSFRPVSGGLPVVSDKHLLATTILVHGGYLHATLDPDTGKLT